MSYTILNLTEATRSNNPQDGDFVQYTYDTGSVVKKHYYTPVESTDAQLQEIEILKARLWRDTELVSTDHIVPLTDHPDHAATLAYRAALRDWPSTSDFPDTKPTL